MAVDEILERECCGKFTSGEQVEEVSLKYLFKSFISHKIIIAFIFNLFLDYTFFIVSVL